MTDILISHTIAVTGVGNIRIKHGEETARAIPSCMRTSRHTHGEWRMDGERGREEVDEDNENCESA